MGFAPFLEGVNNPMHKVGLGVIDSRRAHYVINQVLRPTYPGDQSRKPKIADDIFETATEEYLIFSVKTVGDLSLCHI